MACRHINIGGTVAIVCGLPRAQRCCVCNRADAEVLCDYKVGPRGKLCSRPLCKKCARHSEPDIDHCPTHARMIDAENKPLELFT